MKRSRTMLATVAMLGAAVALSGQASDKLKNPAALTEQAPATYKAKFDTTAGQRSSSKCIAPGRRTAPIASTTW